MCVGLCVCLREMFTESIPGYRNNLFQGYSLVEYDICSIYWFSKESTQYMPGILQVSVEDSKMKNAKSHCLLPLPWRAYFDLSGTRPHKQSPMFGMISNVEEVLFNTK